MSRSRGWWRYVLAPFRFFWSLWSSFGSPLVSCGSSCAPLAPLFPFFWCPWGTCGSPLVSLGPSCAPLVPFLVSLAPSGVPLVSSQPPRSSTWPIGEPLLDLPKERQSRARTPFSENLRSNDFLTLRFLVGILHFPSLGRALARAPCIFDVPFLGGHVGGPRHPSSSLPLPPGGQNLSSRTPWGGEEKRRVEHLRRLLTPGQQGSAD